MAMEKLQVKRLNFGVDRPKWGVEWRLFKKHNFPTCEIFPKPASFHTLGWTWCARRPVICVCIYIYIYMCTFSCMSRYMLQIEFTESKPLLQNRAFVQRPPSEGPFEFQWIWKVGFRVARAMQETCSSEMLGCQGAYSWDRLHFGSSDFQFWEDDFARQLQHFVYR